MKTVVILVILGIQFYMADTQNSSGYEFVVSLMDSKSNKKHPDLAKEIQLVSSQPFDVTVDVVFVDDLGGSVANQTVVIQSESIHRISLPTAIKIEGTTKSKKVIHVKASAAISVYVINIEYPSTDGYLALPVESLGTDYVAVTYGDCGFGCQLAVTATKEPTQVTIQLPVDKVFPIYFQGVQMDVKDSLKVTLDSYETFQLQTSEDLTGTFVSSDKPVAVFSGNKKTGYGGTCCWEHLVEQLPPIQTWGKEFLTFISPGRKSFFFDFYRVITSMPNTTITLPDQVVFFELEGSWMEFNHSTLSVFMVKSDKPILLIKFIVGDGQQSNTDPCMTLLIPTDQWITESVFALHTRYDVNNVLITGSSDLRNDLTLNGRPMPRGTTWMEHTASGLVMASLLLQDATYVLKTAGRSSFAAYLISGAYIESYCFPVGMRLLPVNPTWTRTKRLTADPCFGLHNESYWEDNYLKRIASSTTAATAAPTTTTTTTTATTTTITTVSTTSETTTTSTTTKTLTREEIEEARTKVKEGLVLFPRYTTALRRRMHSYPDDSYTSAVIGWVTVGVMSSIVMSFMCLDRTQFLKDFVRYGP